MADNDFPLNYETVLADLKAKRDKLDAAISAFRSLESDSDLALPPFKPPCRPSAIADASLPSVVGLVSIFSPVAMSTISLASWFGSRGRLGFVAMARLSRSVPERSSI